MKLIPSVVVVDVAEVGIIDGVGVADVGGTFTDAAGVADVGGVFTNGVGVTDVGGVFTDGVGVADVGGVFTSVVAVGLRLADITVVADTVRVDSGMDEFEGGTVGDTNLHE